MKTILNLETGVVETVDLDDADLAQAALDKAAAEAAAPRGLILAQIATLEATITNRRLREAALSDSGKAWLADVDAQIAALRAQL